MYKYSLIIIFLIVSCKKQESPVYSAEIKNWKFNYNERNFKTTIPSNSFYDLLSNKIISDPFYGINEDSVQWVSKKNWTYQSVFTVSPKILKKQTQTLVFNGLDTYAHVYLNDSLILIADNMFRKWDVNVKSILQEKNILLIKFYPVHEIEKEKRNNLGYDLPGGIRVHSRKAAFHYGWDWGPKISTTGIWRPIRLIAYDNCKIQDVYVQQNQITNSIAALSIKIEIKVMGISFFL